MLLSRKSGTMAVDTNAFAVADTAAIDKIELADKAGNKSVLTREGPGRWKLNDKYYADPGRVRNLLRVMKLVELKYPVGEAARQNAIKHMVISGTEVKIYAKGKLLKDYVVGMSTQDRTGTFMYLAGDDNVVVTHEPGFEGYLSPSYISEEKEWRTTALFGISPAEVKQIHIEYPEKPGETFTLRHNDGQFLLSAPGKSEKPINPGAGKAYFSAFNNINFEGFARLNAHQIDSVLATQPFARLTMERVKGDPLTLTLYNKWPDQTTKQIRTDNKMDGDRFYAIYGKWNKELVLMQTLMLDRIMATYPILDRAAAAN